MFSYTGSLPLLGLEPVLDMDFLGAHRSGLDQFWALVVSQAYLQVFRRLLEPLPAKVPEQKLPIWERLASKLSTGSGILYGVHHSGIRTLQ